MSELAQLDRVRRQLQFDHAGSFVSGKIWVFWGNMLSVDWVEYADQMVHSRVVLASGAAFCVTGVYAKCTRVGRRPLWEAMEEVAERVSTSGPWMAAGDFNVVSAMEEREGGAPANARNMEEFNDSMFKCGLFALEFVGPKFTWTNGSVWQRLDRILVNGKWMDAYPVSKEVVNEAWGSEVRGVGMVKFFNKLMNVRHHLKQWNREVFGNVTSNVAQAEQELKQREGDYDTHRTDEYKLRLHEARARYNRELAVECAFWRQKAGIKWIQEGDANTAFFHAAVRQRRNSNFISRIRGEDGGWHEAADEIKEVLLRTIFFRQQARPSARPPLWGSQGGDGG
ncbi:uncharacterized protein LOC113751439 [Coffea eugenioides]|uniref:uncharacterized protein LOC113751439 n=1 Tax=Coffea eugenioides TaxID=49369 RepID=UPI000F612AEA|nr:uncharacterized protein LOC113751439 [Coffea eugenioides]